MVVLGAWVRLTDAGLGCPDWPGCYGHVFPAGSTYRFAQAVHEMVHRYVASKFLPAAAAALPGVRLVGDETARDLVPTMEPAGEEDWGKEYLDLILSVRVVDDLDAAIAHIQRYSSGHTEAIVTADLVSAQRFTREVDAAAVVVNASTRFTDGEQFGFGAEIGISTQKLHARGPMGLRELTTTKYIVTGSGQVRA